MVAAWKTRRDWDTFAYINSYIFRDTTHRLQRRMWHGGMGHWHIWTLTHDRGTIKISSLSKRHMAKDPLIRGVNVIKSQAAAAATVTTTKKKKGSNKQIIYDQLDAWWPFKLWTDFSEGNRRRGVNCPISNCNCNCTIYTGVYMYLCIYAHIWKQMTHRLRLQWMHFFCNLTFV